MVWILGGSFEPFHWCHASLFLGEFVEARREVGVQCLGSRPEGVDILLLGSMGVTLTVEAFLVDVMTID
jgi:hypothetical protein